MDLAHQASILGRSIIKDGLMAEKRKLLRIKNDFQQKLILQTLMMVFISINVVVIYLFLGPLADAGTRTDIIGIVIAIMELIAFGIIYRFSLIASHRIAGPVFVLERSFDRMASGDLEQTIQFRKDDNFHETAEKLNTALSALHERISAIKSTANEASKENALDAVKTIRKQLEYFGHTSNSICAAEDLKK
jgi:methyl-accepting chemotaxis protein